MKNLNVKQNLRPEKGICSYLVKFHRTMDTDYAKYTGLFRALSCALVFPPRRHFEMSQALGFSLRANYNGGQKNLGLCEKALPSNCYVGPCS